MSSGTCTKMSIAGHDNAGGEGARVVIVRRFCCRVSLAPDGRVPGTSEAEAWAFARTC